MKAASHSGLARGSAHRMPWGWPLWGCLRDERPAARSSNYSGWPSVSVCLPVCARDSLGGHWPLGVGGAAVAPLVGSRPT